MNTTPHPIGFIGLGDMGSAMAARLLAAGHPVSAWVRNPATAEKLAHSGIHFLPSISELCARNTVIALNVIQTSDVEDLLFREGGISDHAQAGTVVIDFSTIESTAVQQFAQQLQTKGIDFIDCPVSGGSQGARAGTLTMMAGGKASRFDELLPMLQHLGKTIRHVGPAGAGQAIKAANQMAMCIQLAGIAEAMNYALFQGAELPAVLEILQAGLAGSKVLDWAGPHMVEGFIRQPTIEARLHAKDIRMIANAAKAQGLSLPLLFKTDELLQELMDDGMGAQDTSKVFEIVREQLRG